MFKQVDHRNLPSANTRWPNRWFFTSRREYYELAVKQAEAAYDIVQLLSFRMIPSWGLLNEGYLSFAKIRVADFLDSFLATVSLIFLQQSSNFLKTFLCIEILRLKNHTWQSPWHSENLWETPRTVWWNSKFENILRSLNYIWFGCIWLNMVHQVWEITNIWYDISSSSKTMNNKCLLLVRIEFDEERASKSFQRFSRPRR